MFGNNDKIKVCECDCKTPLIWTFKFIGCEYWCPRCGYSSGMFGAGRNVTRTKEIEKSLEEWIVKATPYLQNEVDNWEYTDN